MITATAKSKIFIGTTAPASSVGDYDGDTWTEVKSVEDLGEFGDSAEEISFSTIEDARVQKLKGIRDAGTIELICGRDAADAGQVKLRAAMASDDAFNFNVRMNDAPAGGTPTEFFFKARVMGRKNVFGKGNEVVRESFTLSITSEILEVPAAAEAA